MNKVYLYDFEEKTNSSIELVLLDMLNHTDNYLAIDFSPVLEVFLKTVDYFEVLFENKVYLKQTNCKAIIRVLKG